MVFKKEQKGEVPPLDSPPKDYAAQKIKEIKLILAEKQAELTKIQGDVEFFVNEANALQQIKDTGAGMYVTEILEMIDEYRRKNFDGQDDLLNTFEAEIIQIALQDLKRRK